MNTKYTLEMLLSRKKKGQNTWIDRPKTCKSIREAKRIIDEDLQPKRAIIKNKRGELIHEYTEGEGWFKTFQKNVPKVKTIRTYGRPKSIVARK